MQNNTQKYKIILLWGIGMYVFQELLSNPQARIQILVSIAISFLIYSANQMVMTNAFYNNKFLRHAIPILIMNCILLPINLIYSVTNSYKFTRSDYLGYFLFNILILIIYVLQHHYFKKRINNLLKVKLSIIE